jgi:GNAT superfamily N-acetyltransferase
MHTRIRIESSSALPADLATELMPAAAQEKFRALEWLRQDWQTGVNRFSKPGEAFYVARLQDRLVGVCGLNRDPYAKGAGVGRIRRLYVLPAFRRRGVGRELVHRVIADGRACFGAFHVRTVDPQAGAFYAAIGFAPAPGQADFTHELILDTAA